MSDFNKTDAEFAPTRKKKKNLSSRLDIKEYHTHYWELPTHNNFYTESRSKELKDYINSWARKGFILDSITPCNSHVSHVLLVFVKN